jgi:hypothetical protein
LLNAVRSGKQDRLQFISTERSFVGRAGAKAPRTGRQGILIKGNPTYIMTVTASADEKVRAAPFRRNAELERLLRTVNDLLGSVEQVALEHFSDRAAYPVVFLMGPLRSGTTLFMQWLANTGVVAYPTNLLSRFFAAPVIGALVQMLLTDPRYKFRNELFDLAGSVSFESENGKTTGALAPNEFWYFWRRFLPFKDLDWLPDEDLFRIVDTKALVAELTALTRVFGQPFALKGMILNYNIRFLDAIFSKVLFVQMHRDPVTNVASVLEARSRQFGRETEWYSFKIPEYPQLKDLDPVMQCAGQVHYINRAVTSGLASVKEARKLVVQYEAFCRNPSAVFDQLIEKLEISGKVKGTLGPEQFNTPRDADLPNRVAIEKALAHFASKESLT